MKKEDVSVEVTDGSLVLRGERKRETEEKKDHLYRSEREYGQFLRTVPLPEGTSLEDVKAMFARRSAGSQRPDAGKARDADAEGTCRGRHARQERGGVNVRRRTGHRSGMAGPVTHRG